MKKCIHKIENMPLQTSSIVSRPWQMSQSACFFSKILCAVVFWQETACVSKARGWPRGLANARPRDSAKFANAQPPGLTRRATECPAAAREEAGRSWNWLMPKSHKKECFGDTNRDSNPPVLTGDLPFSANISSLQLSMFNQYFQHDSLPFFWGFSAIFTVRASEHKPAIILGAVIHWVALTLCKVAFICGLKMQERLWLSTSCSATFWQLLVFRATFFVSSNFLYSEQFLWLPSNVSVK